MTRPPSSAGIAYHRDGALLIARCTGSAGADWLAEAFRLIAEYQRGAPASAVLIDIRDLDAMATVSERYRLGEAAAANWTGPPVALVGTRQLVDPERFGEMVARNRGLDGRVFTDVAEARAWLATRVAARNA